MSVCRLSVAEHILQKSCHLAFSLSNVVFLCPVEFINNLLLTISPSQLSLVVLL